MKRKLLIAVPLLAVVGIMAWVLRPKRESLGEQYVSERSVTLWSSVAQVREPLDTLHYGDRVDVLARRNDNVKVRTAVGQVGWIDGRQLLDPAMWQRSTKLLAQAAAIPVQAHGRTKVQTNLRVEPGRTAQRLYQFGRGVPVDIVARSVADWVQVGGGDDKDASNAPDSPGTKKEDWYLIRAVATRPPGEGGRASDANTTTQPGDSSVPIAGWVVARFVELDLPDAVREGLSSANVRAVAWFELNRVASEDGDKPQYLVVGTKGPEGQPCDFTVLRVYTWNPKRARYETAFIESNACGQLPIRVSKSENGQPEFRFHTIGTGEKSDHVYRLIQTVVRRVPQGDEPTKKGARPAPAKTAAAKTGNR
jgi:hypothetical protein